MWVLLGMLLVAALLAAMIMPWVNRSGIKALEREVQVLRRQSKALTDYLESTGQAIPEAAKLKATVWPWQRAETADSAPAVMPMTTTPPPTEMPEPVPVTIATVPTQQPQEAQPARVSFEQQFGARLPVWIGGVALALAGFFMVKYSIETGLLSPLVRIMLGMIFGLGLLAAAEKLRTRPDVPNGTRIAQALSGAGIADLYVCLFAATSLYGLLPSFLGFMAMAGVTATAVVLSLRHGMPIALLGLVGGLLTPALVSSDAPSAPLLFLYLYAVTAGMMMVIRQKAWWTMALPTMVGGFLWVLLWLLGAHHHTGDTVWLGMFLLATSATYVYLTPRGGDTAAAQPTKLLNMLTLGGATLVMATVVGQGGYSLMAWGLFGLLSLGAIALSYADQERYGFAPWMAMLASLVMLAAWHPDDRALYAVVLLAFASMFVVAAYLLQSRSERPLLWTGLVCASTLLYYLLGYARMHNAYLTQPLLLSDLPFFWGVLAAVIAGISVATFRRLMLEIPNDHPQKAHVLSLYAAQATSFVTLALTIELEREFLSVAVAMQVLALAWINTRVEIARIRWIIGAVATVFAVLLIPQALLLVQLTAYSLVEAQLRLQAGIPIVNWPFFQLGVPAVAFLAASYLLRMDRDDRIVRVLEVAAIALVGVMGYYLTRHAFHVSADVLFVKAGFVERGVITNTLFLYGLGCMFVGRHYARHWVGISGLVLAGVALFRLSYFDLIAYNPIWSSSQQVGDMPILNALLLTYGAPILWSAWLVKELPARGVAHLSRYVQGFMLLLAFILVSYQVTQMFHGSVLDQGVSTNAEIYSYSVAWLLLGLGLLLVGTARVDKLMRVASLLLMILTVGKVFLYDASELEGLYRVFSFLGLGISLLGLSWFYTRFVFGTKNA